MLFELFYGIIGSFLIMIGLYVADDMTKNTFPKTTLMPVMRCIGFICGICLAVLGGLLIALAIAYWIQT